MQSAERRPQTADRRPQTADRRPQTADPNVKNRMSANTGFAVFDIAGPSANIADWMFSNVKPNSEP
ncbi:hypothetical protein GQF01_15655 [Paenibacillus sp. 5J-6]|uniref:Uncharacterized protein n=1 Tax=Paenibacillus silvestris TaxID=2606219 RepID=A0A6L8UZ95_9BACL|nr:hypothetical protein [Paenibacillus silvestris]MZQ83548.1 hypothetical protein [Paenibacillus silvestris]